MSPVQRPASFGVFGERKAIVDLKVLLWPCGGSSEPRPDGCLLSTTQSAKRPLLPASTAPHLSQALWSSWCQARDATPCTTSVQRASSLHTLLLPASTPSKWAPVAGSSPLHQRRPTWGVQGRACCNRFLCSATHSRGCVS